MSIGELSELSELSKYASDKKFYSPVVMKMTDLTYFFMIGQKVKCNMDGELFDGIVKEVFKNHIIVDIPGISDHCWFKNGVNMDCIYPNYN